ncbi:hypothetical protein Droror1_Dr00003380 [Drosera rotundifolia]
MPPSHKLVPNPSKNTTHIDKQTRTHHKSSTKKFKTPQNKMHLKTIQSHEIKAQPRIRTERKNNNPTKIRENPILNQQSYFTQTQQYEKSRFEIGPSPSLSNRLNASLNSEICSSVN